MRIGIGKGDQEPVEMKNGRGGPTQGLPPIPAAEICGARQVGCTGSLSRLYTSSHFYLNILKKKMCI